MNDVDNREGALYDRPYRSGFKVLLAGTNPLRLEKIKAFLSKRYDTGILELTSQSDLQEIPKVDVFVLAGRSALSYLAQITAIVDRQVPILGYELRATADERVKARTFGVISFVNSSPEGAELFAAIENISSWVAGQAPQQEKDPNFKKELLEALKHLLEVQPAFNVEELGQHMKLSHSTLYRKVRETFGQSPNRLIAAYRSQRAAELLKANEFNITEVGYTCGFSSATYFARTFKQFYGMSPGQYRKNWSSAARFVRKIE